MDREIKFEYGFSAENGIIKNVYKLSQIHLISKICDVWDKLPICYVRQFIGLKDKNGVDIYEGDILCDSEEQTYQKRGVVKFSHGVFGVEWLIYAKNQTMVGIWGQKHNLRRLDDDILDSKIIIGNIYENPELVK